MILKFYWSYFPHYTRGPSVLLTYMIVKWQSFQMFCCLLFSYFLLKKNGLKFFFFSEKKKCEKNATYSCVWFTTLLFFKFAVCMHVWYMQKLNTYFIWGWLWRRKLVDILCTHKSCATNNNAVLKPQYIHTLQRNKYLLRSLKLVETLLLTLKRKIIQAYKLRCEP